MIGIKKPERKEIKYLLFSFFTAFLLITLCSKNSFLYPINYWVDLNCFYSMGKAIDAGQIIYRDVFDHKGPLLHFLFYIANLISPNTYFGAYIFEILSTALFLYFSSKCIRLYIKNDLYVILSLISLMAWVSFSPAFVHGGSPEEFCLPLLSYSLYIFLKHITSGSAISSKNLIATGICIGVLFWIKYTMTGFYIGAFLFLAATGIIKKDFKKLLKITLLLIIGFLIVSVPVIIYFLCNNALGDLLKVYFYDNIFKYAAQNSLFSKLCLAADAFISNTVKNPACNIIALFGILYFIIKKYKTAPFILASFTFMAAGVYSGGVFSIYYNLIFSIYTIFGFIAVFKILEKIKINPLVLSAVFTGIFTAAISCRYFSGSYIYLAQYGKENLPQYKFAKIINLKENPTLLNYGSLDGGFYFAAGIAPSCKYFYVPNLNMPEILEEQQSYVREKKIDFIVTKNKKLEEDFSDAILKDYRLICEDSFLLHNTDIRYYLYQKI